MPRCQWCRQDSQDQNVCDWCKRPLAAGWTPVAAAVPADRMSFAVAEEPSSDRLLMFSMLGIVAVVGLAFAVSFFTRRQALPTVQPPAPPIEQPVVVQRPNPPAVVQNNGPVPAPLSPSQEFRPSQPQVEAYQPPPPSSRARPYHVTGNRKLDGLTDAVTDLD